LSFNPEFFIGAEYRLLPILFFRAGYGQFNWEQAGIVCLGAGLQVKGIYMDYAFNGRSDLDWAGGHRIGLGYRIFLNE